jgi:kynurenine formamidase
MMDKLNQFLDLLRGFECVDLTHILEENIPTFPGHTKFFMNEWVSAGDPAFLNVISMGDHSGTHFDAPAHFNHDKADPARLYCHEIDPMALVGRAVKLTFGPFEAVNATIGAKDIKAWEAKNRAITPEDIVIFDYQWANKWRLVTEGSEFTDKWPGIDPSAAEYLLQKKIRAVGTDCLSIDAADGCGYAFPGHLDMLRKGVLVLENLCNLEKLPNEFALICLPLKLRDAGGSPVRAVALVPR